MSWTIHHGDCREVMATLDAKSVDAIVTDPPYGLSFMGKGWDHGVPGVEFWTEAMRVAKPGAHLLAFGGTRTYHRLACAIEDAGWEVRDCVMWVYGSGFPKSHNVANAIDKSLGCDNRGRAIPAASTHFPSGRYASEKLTSNSVEAYKARTKQGEPWQGWGTALKPAWEPIIVARKPLVGTVSENVLTHGTGAINVDGCRVPGALEGDPTRFAKTDGGSFNSFTTPPIVRTEGRWPANLIHDGSDGPSSLLGSAARFFYCAKASKADRDEGCEGLPQTIKQSVAHGDKRHGTLPYTNEPREMKPRPRGNHHPTVKPTALMRYLCRLVTPPGGIVLDPFTGSGSTGKGAVLEGFRFIGIEREAEYVEIAKARIGAAVPEPTLFVE